MDEVKRNESGGPVNGGGDIGNRRRRRRNRGRGGKHLAGGVSKQKSFLTNNSVRKESYNSVPSSMFYCHLCKKHMWDAESFVNHIKGGAHVTVRKVVEESYRIQAKVIQQDARIKEELKAIEFDNFNSVDASGRRPRDYCTMCDIFSSAPISIHRTSDGHLELKKFLHPKCNECNKEFTNRGDYDSHLLSAFHLKKAAKKKIVVGEKKYNKLCLSTMDDEARDLFPPSERSRKRAEKGKCVGSAVSVVKEKGVAEGTAEVEPIATKDDVAKSGVVDSATVTGGNQNKNGEEYNETQEGAPLPELADIILDFNKDDVIPSEIQGRLPKYDWLRGIGTGLITKLDCYECSICGKYLDSKKTVEVHSRTASHHANFLKFIKEKSKYTAITQKRAAIALDAVESKKKVPDQNNKFEK